jgi:tetratricopeptide (TPR) repeat protein
MKLFRIALVVGVSSLTFAALSAQPPAKSSGKKDDGKLPLTKLAPAKLFPGLCVVKYPVSTRSSECQAYVDQGLGYYYSYVWMEAARSFETAVQRDPECAFAWWGLSKSIEKWNEKTSKSQATTALTRAKELLPNASQRESLLIKSRLAEKGMMDGVTPENRKKEAAKYLDELLTLYDDDEEAWFARAQVADGGINGAIPYYKALLRVNPLHPGGHHELVHLYENIRRPALGWQHALGYMESSPGMPHAFHMQAHLAMRIGKWDKTADWSARAVEMERAYHKAVGVKPFEDHQYPHHLEILTISLTHDGRFREAKEIKAIAEAAKYQQKLPWFHLHLAERDWDAALKLAETTKKDKLSQSYMRALVYLRKGDAARAAGEVHVLQEAYAAKRTDKELETRLWETQGQLMAQTGQGDGGLKLLKKTVDQTKNDFKHHSWGHGAYYMEQWGVAALYAGKLDVAEEAFLESLAHDARSVRGALGMQVVCERLGRTEEASRFAELAGRCWQRADAGQLEKELAAFRAALQQSLGHATSAVSAEN